jgi:hypothetical protein
MNVELCVAELELAEAEDDEAKVKKCSIALKIAKLKLAKAELSAKRECDTLSERSVASTRSALLSVAASTRNVTHNVTHNVPRNWVPNMPIFLEKDCDYSDCEGVCGYNHNDIGIEGRDGFFLPANEPVPVGYCPDDRVPERCRDYTCSHDHARGRAFALRKHSEQNDNSRSNKYRGNNHRSDYRSDYRSDHRSDYRSDYRSDHRSSNNSRKISDKDLLELLLSRHK